MCDADADHHDGHGGYKFNQTDRQTDRQTDPGRRALLHIVDVAESGCYGHRL